MELRAGRKGGNHQQHRHEAEAHPAGQILMGSPKEEEGHHDNEGPQHEVEITKAF